MDKKEFIEEFEKYLEKMQIKFSEEQYNQFYKYMNLLIEWNKKINLTAIIEPKEIILKHFVDSLTIAKYIEENKKVADVGTGAGFPGIPLKIYRKDLKITLIDSLNKRLNFLNEVISELELKEITTVHGRAEELGQNKEYRERFDIVTSRAVANLSTLSEYLIPFIKKDGKCIYMKTLEVDEELQKAKKAINILGGKTIKIDKFYLPESEIGRSIVVIEKEKQTPIKYPRKPGTPSKEPL